MYLEAHGLAGCIPDNKHAKNFKKRSFYTMQSAVKKIKLAKMREMVVIVATLFEPFYLPSIYNLRYVLGLLLLLGRKA